MAGQTIASGRGYSVEMEGTHVVAKLWRLREVDFTEGARLAKEAVTALVHLLPRARTILLDVTEATTVAGPETIGAFGAFANACESAGVSLAVLMVEDPLQSLQVKRVIQERAPKAARAFTDAAAADAWLRTTRKSTRPPPAR